MVDNPIRYRLLIFLLFLMFGGCGTAPSQPTSPQQQNLLSLVRQSGFIFAGRIEKIGAATAGLSVQDNTAVVRVLRVIDEQPPIDEIKDHAVTVRLRDVRQAKAGQTAVFFTHLYSAGMSLGLDEAGQLPDSADIDQSVHAARMTLADDALRARLKSASIVAVATVMRVAPIESASPRSEHEPMWWNATLQVADVFKGDAKKGVMITVRFASNYDAYWGASPKPKVGDHAIYLMQPTSAVRLFGEAPSELDKQTKLNGLFLIDNLDVISADQAERVRRLLSQ
jgi:hypothetical protein